MNFQIKNLESEKKHKPKLLIAQPSWEDSEWESRYGIYKLLDSRKAGQYISRFTELADEHQCSLILFPELSVPIEFIQDIEKWTNDNEVIVIAGSHYYSRNQKTVNRCPVIFRGRTHFVEKLNPAPAELSAVAGDGISGGESAVVFDNSPVGRLGVLICADYLSPEVHNNIMNHDLDVLCISAFQRDSTTYHQRIDIDVESSESGLFVAYANNRIPHKSDGRSAFFGVVDNIYKNGLFQRKHVNETTPFKSLVVEASGLDDAIVVQVDIEKKRPSIPRTSKTVPNVKVYYRGQSCDLGSVLADDEEDVTRAAATDDVENGSVGSLSTGIGSQMLEILNALSAEGSRDSLVDFGNVFTNYLWYSGKYFELEYVGEALEDAAVRIDNPKLQSEALIDFIGWSQVSRGEMLRGRKSIERGKTIAKENGLYDWECKALRHLAALEFVRGDLRSCYKFLTDSFVIARSILDYDEKISHMAPLFYGFAEYFIRTKKISPGRKAHRVAKNLYKIIGSPTKAVKIQVQEGLLNEVMGDMESARKSYVQALNHAESNKRVDDAIRALDGLSRVYSSLNKMDISEKYRKESAKWRKKTPILVS